MYPPLTIAERNPNLPADSLTELLSWDGVEFVRCAYATLLGRQPDTQGEAFYVDTMRRGKSKIEILLQLRQSSEGLLKYPEIAGLDTELRRRLTANVPLPGTVNNPIANQTKHSPTEHWFTAINGQIGAARLVHFNELYNFQRQLALHSANTAGYSASDQDLHAAKADAETTPERPISLAEEVLATLKVVSANQSEVRASLESLAADLLSRNPSATDGRRDLHKIPRQAQNVYVRLVLPTARSTMTCA